MTMKSRDFTRRHRYPHSPQPTGCFPGKRQCSNAVSHADPTPPTHTGDGRQGGSKRRANTGIESLTASTNQQHNGTRTAEKCGAGGYLAVARQARQPLAQAEFGDGAPAAATWGGEVGGRGRRRSCIPASRSGSLRFCCGAAVRAAVVGGVGCACRLCACWSTLGGAQQRRRWTGSGSSAEGYGLWAVAIVESCASQPMGYELLEIWGPDVPFWTQNFLGRRGYRLQSRFSTCVGLKLNQNYGVTTN
jgi:hypothetical protein